MASAMAAIAQQMTVYADLNLAQTSQRVALALPNRLPRSPQAMSCLKGFSLRLQNFSRVFVVSMRCSEPPNPLRRGSTNALMIGRPLVTQRLIPKAPCLPHSSFSLCLRCLSEASHLESAPSLRSKPQKHLFLD